MVNPLTPYPEVNHLLDALLLRVQTILGEGLIGLYLSGSLANGDFDRASDVDVIVVTNEEVSGGVFTALSEMHQRLAMLDSWCATQLEVTYISRVALRRFDPAQAWHANLDRGHGERLKLMQYDEGWVAQCHVLRERGITVVGLDPRTLIDPVSPDDLRQAMVAILRGWATHLLQEPTSLSHRGYQSYTVLSMCRILYTLHHGAIVSKPVAAQWAQASLDERWAPLIQRAWLGRQQPNRPASGEDLDDTLDFIRYALENVRPFETPLKET